MKDILLFALLLVAGATAIDKSSNGGGSYTKVLGHSGKISIGRADPPSKDPNGVVIEMDELKERDKDGNEVGKSGNPKHSFNTFASQDFTFSDLNSVTYQGVDAVNFNFSSTINGATLRILTYIFTEKGLLKNGNETIEVNNGTCKFNIQIDNWTFCSGGNCAKNEEGMYLDLKITVKGKKQAEKDDDDDDKNKGKKPNAYELGGGTEILISNEVNVDGKWMDTPDGYPKFEQQGGKDYFIFRFPKFNSSVFYDPSINLGFEEIKNGSSNIKFNFSLLALVIVPLLAFIF